MAAPIGTVRAEISANAVKFYSEMERVRQTTRRTGTDFKGMGEEIKGLGKVQGVFTALVGGLGGMGGAVTQVTSKLAALSAGVGPLAIGIGAVVAGFAFYIQRGERIAEINRDMEKTQLAFAKSVAVTAAEIEDLRKDTKTAVVVSLDIDLEAAKKDLADAKSMLSGTGAPLTDLLSFEQREADFQKVRLKVIEIENQIVLARAKIQHEAEEKRAEEEKKALDKRKKEELKAAEDVADLEKRITKQRWDEAATRRESLAAAAAEEDATAELLFEAQKRWNDDRRTWREQESADWVEAASSVNKIVFALEEEEALRKSLVGLQGQELEIALRTLEHEKQVAQRDLAELGAGPKSEARVAAVFESRKQATIELLKFSRLSAQVFERMTDGLSSDVAGAFMDVQSGAKSAGEALGDLAKSVIADLQRMILKAVVFQALMSAFGGAAGGGAFAGAQASAQGTGKMATGGSFQVAGAGGTDSTLVAFKASPGERVSVETPSQQGRGGGLTVVVNNYTDARVTAEEPDFGGARELVVTVEKIIEGSIAGGGRVGRSIERTYGTRRQPRRI